MLSKPLHIVLVTLTFATSGPALAKSKSILVCELSYKATEGDSLKTLTITGEPTLEDDSVISVEKAFPDLGGGTEGVYFAAEATNISEPIIRIQSTFSLGSRGHFVNGGDLSPGSNFWLGVNSNPIVYIFSSYCRIF